MYNRESRYSVFLPKRAMAVSGASQLKDTKLVKKKKKTGERVGAHFEDLQLYLNLGD